MYDDTWRIFNVRLNSDRQDEFAQLYLPLYGLNMDEPFCVKSTGNGDCFFNSASRLIYGCEDMAQELRIRMVRQGMEFTELYLDHNYLALKFDSFVPHGTIQTLPDYYAYTCESWPKVHEAYRTNQLVFRAELVRMSCQYAYAHCWAMHLLADVARRPVISMYPSFGDEDDSVGMMKDSMNRVIYPMYEEDHSREPLCILWTKFRPQKSGGALVDHFVPVVP